MALSLQDINAYNGEQPAEKLPFPIIADKNRELAVKLGMLDPDELDKDGMPLTARVVSACPHSTCAFPAVQNHGLPSCPVSVGQLTSMDMAILRSWHDFLGLEPWVVSYREAAQRWPAVNPPLLVVPVSD